ncbi:hypothetical protein Dsin_000069 [Dipteronia sinensis]|uniref:Uncharacterized protein n=1 Tax=Dipteronia sinensis TaxID=43782 RepID=A0AAE0DH83_9ROSI|nr:hypothetical protein Dsin_000069 [Dipteronia sinensis]
MAQSFLTPSSSKKVPVMLNDDNTKRNGWSFPWHWSRMRKGIRTRKVSSLVRRSSINDHNEMTAGCSHAQVFSTEDNPRVQEDDIYNSGLSRHDTQLDNSRDYCNSNTSLGHKYQPKAFQDIVGHELIVKAVSKAAQKKKVANLYLFYGSSGNGKTSTARIFSMALHCDSVLPSKPCWSCRGCSRSLYITDLCSGSRTTGFQKIRTLLQNTSFMPAVPGFKVFIIEECHLLTAEAWDELLCMIEGSYGSTLVFVLITEDATTIPKIVSSRCQKFCFPKLKDMDVTLKLAKIIAQEDIEIETEALKLIVVKAEGSLREAENILDQLTLLGARITSSMVQQIVGLAPQDKLVNLLSIALSGDIEGTIICTRQLIATGVEAHALVSQLVSLITDTLSNAVILTPESSSLPCTSKYNKLLNSRSQLTNNHSERLSYALKILVELENEPRSSISQTTWIFMALLHMTRQDVANRASTGTALPRDIMLPSGEKSNTESECILCQNLSHNKTDTIGNLHCIRDMENIWHNMLGKIQSKYMKEFLYCQVKLASLTVSSAKVIVHLMFKRPEDKLAAQMSEESISRALTDAIGCPVTINMSIEPVDLETIQDTVSTSKNLIAGHGHSGQQERTLFPPEFVYNRNSEAPMHHTHQNPSSPSDKDCIIKPEKAKHRWLSLSSIQQSDASVEPYSQDILFENDNKEKESRARKNLKLRCSSFRAYDDHHSQDSARNILYRSWSCKEILCQGKPKLRHVQQNP